MQEYKLRTLIGNPERVNENINGFLKDKTLFKQEADEEEIRGHLQKAENNLRFIAENIKLNFLDWAITGCYYACYHAALALIQTRGYTSKSHIATLCVLIKEFYRQGLNKNDFELLSDFLDYQDVLFYVESKNKRENATYSSRLFFDKKEVIGLRMKAAMFVNKARHILDKI